jgi:hypothetical protein
MIVGLLELAVLVAIPVLLVMALMRQRVTPAPGQLVIVCGRPDPAGAGFSLASAPTRVVPLLERAELFDSRPLALELRRTLLSQEGTPLEMTLRARVRFGDSPELRARWLALVAGRGREQIRDLAADALASALGMVGAICAAEELLTAPNVAGLVRTQAAEGLARLGLEVEAVEVARAHPSSDG